MLKQTVTYKDFDDVQQTETLYFNLTRTDLADLMDLLPKLEEWQKRVSGDDRQLTIPEIRDFLDIIKMLIEHSYGKRDGNKHYKSKEIFADFKASMAYDAFVFSLFQDITKAVNFMVEIIPMEMLDEASQTEIRKQVDSISNLPDVVDNSDTEMNTTVEEVPVWERENREPTRAEFSKMTPEELQRAFRIKIAKDNK